ncbi:hypothetical protein PMSD_26905 [Paenibacillus macquariensis subsp. defensor]|nr:hypothetical protein PMSD_26905 [Paenibacillus macquariensis subsp. defensor]
MIGLVGLVYAVKEISRREGSYVVALISAIIGIIAMIIFVRRQRKSADPLIDFGLFKDSQFTTGVITALLSCFALIGMESLPIVRDSLDEALIVAENLPATAGASLIKMAQTAFDKSFVVVLANATIILFVAAFMIRSLTNRTIVRDNNN